MYLPLGEWLQHKLKPSQKTEKVFLFSWFRYIFLLLSKNTQSDKTPIYIFLLSLKKYATWQNTNLQLSPIVEKHSIWQNTNLQLSAVPKKHVIWQTTNLQLSTISEKTRNLTKYQFTAFCYLPKNTQSDKIPIYSFLLSPKKHAIWQKTNKL